MTSDKTNSQNIRIAESFWRDSSDLLYRYEITRCNFWNTKSRRTKLVMELRFAAECLYKSAIALKFANQHETDPLEEIDLLKKIFKLGHDLPKLRSEAMEIFRDVDAPNLDESHSLLNLPVDLRYLIDGDTYLYLLENHYYMSIGNDDWITSTYETILGGSKSIGEKLGSYSGIVHASEISTSTDSPTMTEKQKKWIKKILEADKAPRSQ